VSTESPASRAGWTLRRRLSLTFALLGVLVVAGTGAAAGALARLNSAQHRQVDRLDPAIQTSTDLFISLVNQETGLRGFALTHQEQFLTPYLTGRAATDADLGLLRTRVAGEPRIRRDVDALANAARAWQTSYAVPAVAIIKATPRNQIPRVEFTRGKSLFDRVRAAYDRMNTSFGAARQQARSQLRTSTWLLVALVAGATLLAVLISFGLWTALRRWITRPLSGLRGEVRTVAAGILDHPVRASGPPEIVELGADAELMRLRMLDEYRAAVTARAQAQAAAAQVGRQAEELRRSNAELEQFAYIASHDLQEPLRKVASFCQMLQRRYSGQLDERADQYIDFAVDGAKRMQNLINDLLAFSRVGHSTAGFRPVDLKACVAAAAGDLETLLAETEAHIDVGDLPNVPGDLSLLRQLFVNLIGNAVKFRGEQPPRVRITAERAGDFWTFTVTDNGIGIDPRYAEKVFAIFSRLQSRDRYDGTGIGLALCRKIVEFHGGTINVVTGPDAPAASGATLRFTLPVTARPASAGPSSTAGGTAGPPSDLAPASVGAPSPGTGDQ
jgi:signal transduction histidine kinase